MGEITQSITEFVGDLPNKDTMTESEFNVAAEAWVEYQDGIAAEVNAFSTQANSLRTDCNTAKTDAEAALASTETARDTAAASANFAGNWSDLTGALAMPASVWHDGKLWLLLTDLADVTASEPSPSNTDWGMFLVYGLDITSKTADYEITAVEMAAGNKIFTNEGAGAEVEFTLPGRADNYRVRFLVSAAQYLKIVPPSGEKIYYLSDETATDGYVRSNTPGDSFEIIGSATEGYRIVNLTGSLHVDE